MTFVDAFHDRAEDVIRVVERDPDTGDRILRDWPAPYVFYHSDKNGKHVSIFGDRLRKVTAKTGRQFRGMVADAQKRGRATFESDINPVFRLLANEYLDKPLPKLRVGFFDIEVGFDPARGYAPTEDPFSPVTAVSVHNTHTGVLTTLALAPPGMAFEDACAAVADIPDTFVFDDERDLFEAYFALVDDVDVLSGWNCIAKTEGVWLSDRITPLSEVTKGNRTLDHGAVVRWMDSGRKAARRLVLEDGSSLLLSDEHVLPIASKRPDHHIRSTVLIRSQRDMNVSEMRRRMADGDMLYAEIRLRNNTNAPLTLRRFLLDHIDFLNAHSFLGLVLTQRDIRMGIRERLRAVGRFDEYFPYPERFHSPTQHSRAWTTRKLAGFVTAEDARAEVEGAEELIFAPSGNRAFRVGGLDEPIAADVFQFLGLLFTDGSRGPMRAFDGPPEPTDFVLYGKHEQQMEWYRGVYRAHTQGHGHRRDNPLKLTRKDGMRPVPWSRQGIFALLLPMVYDTHWKKQLQREMLSRLSRCQFAAFISGIIDGDGCVSNGVLQICNYESQLPTLQELLRWNGVYATVTSANLVVSPTSANKAFVDALTLRHPDRATKAKSLAFTVPSNSPNSKLKRMLFDDRAFVRVRAIEDVGSELEMADIQTEGSYFVCRGMRVHNSEGFDVPYMVNRAKRLGFHSHRFCLFGEKPREREFVKFQKSFKTYELVGRVHLDYLLLYQKHNPQQHHSYRLDFIGEIVVGENKVPYEGTLDDLYHKDFLRFVLYNRQDTALLAKIDAKKKFIDLANQIAHGNGVPLRTTMGSVALVEQAIINEMHAMGFIVPDRKRELVEQHDDVELADEDDDEPHDDKRTPVVGAYVAKPRIGLHDMIACCDINSLYPSAIRALNMSPETVRGQIRPDATMALVRERIASGVKKPDAWEGLFALVEIGKMHEQDPDFRLTVDWDDPTWGSTEMSAAELYELIFDPANHFCITANGTIFDTSKDGMIPMLLGKWYAERKQMQSISKEFFKLSAEGVALPSEIAALLRSGR